MPTYSSRAIETSIYRRLSSFGSSVGAQNFPFTSTAVDEIGFGTATSGSPISTFTFPSDFGNSRPVLITASVDFPVDALASIVSVAIKLNGATVYLAEDVRIASASAHTGISVSAGFTFSNNDTVNIAVYTERTLTLPVSFMIPSVSFVALG